MVIATEELEAVERQLGRRPRALAGIAARCPHGGPAVLEQAPYDSDGTPFPTLHWLSCRPLVEAIGRLESSGGVARLERELAADPLLQADLARAEARMRRRRAELAPAAGPRLDGGAALATGVGGTAPGGGLKCLHAHAALALASPPHVLGERALLLAQARYPGRCCAWA